MNGNHFDGDGIVGIRGCCFHTHHNTVVAPRTTLKLHFHHSTSTEAPQRHEITNDTGLTAAKEIVQSHRQVSMANSFGERFQLLLLSVYTSIQLLRMIFIHSIPLYLVPSKFKCEMPKIRRKNDFCLFNSYTCTCQDIESLTTSIQSFAFIHLSIHSRLRSTSHREFGFI